MFIKLNNVYRIVSYALYCLIDSFEIPVSIVLGIGLRKFN